MIQDEIDVFKVQMKKILSEIDKLQPNEAYGFYQSVFSEMLDFEEKLDHVINNKASHYDE